MIELSSIRFSTRLHSKRHKQHVIHLNVIHCSLCHSSVLQLPGFFYWSWSCHTQPASLSHTAAAPQTEPSQYKLTSSNHSTTELSCPQSWALCPWPEFQSLFSCFLFARFWLNTWLYCSPCLLLVGRLCCHVLVPNPCLPCILSWNWICAPAITNYLRSTMYTVNVFLNYSI